MRRACALGLVLAVLASRPSPAAGKRRTPQMPEDLPGAQAKHPKDAPKRVQDQFKSASREAEQASHQAVERTLNEYRKQLRASPSDAKLRRKLVKLLRQAGRAHEAAHNTEAAAAVLQEVLELDPPPEVLKWDAWEANQGAADDGADDGPSAGQGVCVSAPRMGLELPALDIDPLLFHKPVPEDDGAVDEAGDDFGVDWGGVPELHVSLVTRAVLKQHVRRSAPLIIRDGAVQPHLCSVTATSLAEEARSKIIKMAFAHPSDRQHYFNSTHFLDELYLLHNVSEWNAATKKVAGDHAAALLHSPTQWMRFGTFIKLASEPATGPTDRRVNMYQGSVPTQLTPLVDMTNVPNWASKVLGAPIEQNVWIGSGGTVSRLHFDELDNVIAAVRGNREIMIFPPTSRRELVFDKAADLMPAYDDDPISDSGKNFRVQIRDKPVENFALRDHLRDNAIRKVDDAWPAGTKVTLKAGDALFLPAFWAHAVHQSAGGSTPHKCFAASFKQPAAFHDDHKCLSIAVNWWFPPVVDEKALKDRPWTVRHSKKAKSSKRNSRKVNATRSGDEF